MVRPARGESQDHARRRRLRPGSHPPPVPRRATAGARGDRNRGEPAVRCPTEAIARRPTSTSRGSTCASSGPCSRPRARGTTAECVAKHKPAPTPSECWIVAVALVRSETVRTTPLGGCDRPAAGAAPQNRTPEFGRKHERRTTGRGRDKDARFPAKRSRARNSAAPGGALGAGGVGSGACFHAIAIATLAGYRGVGRSSVAYANETDRAEHVALSSFVRGEHLVGVDRDVPLAMGAGLRPRHGVVLSGSPTCPVDDRLPERPPPKGPKHQTQATRTPLRGMTVDAARTEIAHDLRHPAHRQEAERSFPAGRNEYGRARLHRPGRVRHVLDEACSRR